MTNISLILTPKLRLEQALKKAGIENPASVICLTIAGTMTEADFRYIRQNMPKTLQKLDMKKATVEENLIEDECFECCTGLTSVIIPDSVTEISSTAFGGCTGLTSLTIGSGVTEIGCITAFSEGSLTSIEVAEDNTAYASADGVLFNKDKTILITYPDGKQGAYTIPADVISIEEFAFCECSGLTSITIPDSLKKIGYATFLGCTALTTVTIPNSIVEIGHHAFCRCSGLTAVTIPASVTKIGDLAFDNCTRLASTAVHPGNPAYRSDNGVLFNSDMTELILYPQARQGDYAVPDSVIEIHTRAFDKCTGLTSVTLPDSLQVIGFCAFGGCTGLTSIALPDSVTKIRGFAFSRCTGLTSIVIPRSVKKIEKNAFVDCHNLTAIMVHPENPVYTSKNGKIKRKKNKKS